MGRPRYQRRTLLNFLSRKRKQNNDMFISRWFTNIDRKLNKIMATLQERFDAVNERLDTAGSKLTEASAEILAELEKLRAGGTLTPEQEASLANIEAKAQAIADTASGFADVSPPVG